MHELIANLGMLLWAIAKVAIVCGIAPGIAIAIFANYFRIVEVGFEQVRGGQLAKQQSEAHRDGTDRPRASLDWATSPPRKVRAA